MSSSPSSSGDHAGASSVFPRSSMQESRRRRPRRLVRASADHESDSRWSQGCDHGLLTQAVRQVHRRRGLQEWRGDRSSASVLYDPGKPTLQRNPAFGPEDPLAEARIDRRDLGPLRRLADRRGLLSGGDLRLGPRLLRPERLCRRAASPARLADLADFDGDDLLLSVRRVAGRLRQRSDPGVRPAQLPAGRRVRDGGGRPS